MRAVQFDAVEACLLRANGRGDEVFRKLLDFGGGQRPRPRFGIVGGRDRLRADQGRRRTHARMMQLHERETARSLMPVASRVRPSRWASE